MSEVKRHNALLAWIRSFDNVSGASSVEKLSDLADGALLYDCMSSLSPQHFDGASTLKRDVGENWLLRVNNVTKLVDHLRSWYRENLGAADAVDVDASAIGKSANESDIAHLLELIVGVMVECEEKAVHISRIPERLDVEAQEQLKMIIQDLMNQHSGFRRQADHADEHHDRSAAHNELDTLNRRIHELEQQTAELSALRGEKKKLLDHVSQLEQKLSESEQKTQQALAAAAEERKAAEATLLAPRTEALEAERRHLEEALHSKEIELEELRSKAESASRLERTVRDLRDQCDVLNEQLETAKKSEAVAKRLQKRAEEVPELKRRLKELESNAAKGKQTGADVEAEKKRAGTLKAQLDESSQALAKVRSEVSALKAKLSAKEATVEKLRSEIAEGHQRHGTLGSSANAEANATPGDHAAAHGGPSWHEESLAGEELAALRAEIESLKAERDAALEKAGLAHAALRTTAEAASPVPGTTSSGDEAATVATLTAEKTRLEGYLRTAKTMIRDMRTKKKEEMDKQIAELQHSHSIMVNDLKEQIARRDEELEKHKLLLSESREASLREQQLILSALYDAGMEVQRQRTAGTSANAPQSFLQRQREHVMKKL